MFDRGLADYWEPPVTASSQSLLADLMAAAREENRICARRLRTVGVLFEMRREERGESEDWAVDTWAAVGAEIAAALRISLGKAGGVLNDAQAMDRLPAVAAIFDAGEIDANTFRTIAFRTGLITDDDVMAEVDQLIAARAARWPSLTRGRLIAEIDRVVARRDPDAVRRTREKAEDRNVTVWGAADGHAEISGLLFSTDAHLLDERLTALAATVCEQDPRTKEQRRADALGALAAGAQRLMCRCAHPDCPAAAATPSPVVIHVVAEQSSLDGTSAAPGYLLGADALITADLLREQAAAARIRPLLPPPDAAGEPGYRPSRALADFVRARDLTCRAPGCDRPATDCDLDHTVPYPRGATHASNLKCLCRLHHILKTFWGWRDRQLPDGSVIWTLPDDSVYVTAPGSALLFPALCAPTGALPLTNATTQSTAHLVMMPKRRTTRARGRAQRIAAERAHNRRRRTEAVIADTPPNNDADPPPF